MNSMIIYSIVALLSSIGLAAAETYLTQPAGCKLIVDSDDYSSAKWSGKCQSGLVHGAGVIDWLDDDGVIVWRNTVGPETGLIINNGELEVFVGTGIGQAVVECRVDYQAIVTLVPSSYQLSSGMVIDEIARQGTIYAIRECPQGKHANREFFIAYMPPDVEVATGKTSVNLNLANLNWIVKAFDEQSQAMQLQVKSNTEQDALIKAIKEENLYLAAAKEEAQRKAAAEQKEAEEKAASANLLKAEMEFAGADIFFPLQSGELEHAAMLSHFGISIENTLPFLSKFSTSSDEFARRADNKQLFEEIQVAATRVPNEDVPVGFLNQPTSGLSEFDFDRLRFWICVPSRFLAPTVTPNHNQDNVPYYRIEAPQDLFSGECSVDADDNGFIRRGSILYLPLNSIEDAEKFRDIFRRTKITADIFCHKAQNVYNMSTELAVICLSTSIILRSSEGSVVFEHTIPISVNFDQLGMKGGRPQAEHSWKYFLD